MNKTGRTNSPKVKNKYKEDILLIKRSNPNLSGAKIVKALEKAYPTSKYIPKKRAVEKVIQNNRDIWENTLANDLDKPWSIGISEKYGIPPEIIPTLIECEKIQGIRFTIREARWFARLKPAVFEMVNKKFPKETPLGYLSMAAYRYSHKEKIYDLMHNKSEIELDTTELDNDIFYNTIEGSLPKGLIPGFDKPEK